VPVAPAELPALLVGKKFPALFERDRNVNDRLQGYRVHTSPCGSLALYAAGPPYLFDAFGRTCGAPNRAVRLFTEEMRLLLAFDGGLIADTDPVARNHAASRITLRQVLLDGLDKRSLHESALSVRHWNIERTQARQ
jgi:hypothetical protein